MSFVQHNLVAFLVALVTCTYAWVWGGTRSVWVLNTAPWTWALLLEGMFLFPQREEGETSPEARKRVWKGIRRDPFAWTIGLFLLLMMIPFFNTAPCPICDAQALADGAKPGPLLPFLPFCTNRYEHLNVFLWFGPTLTAALAARHSLAKSGQRLVFRLIVLSASALAIFGFIQMATGARAPFWAKPPEFAAPFFASFGYANMAADYFMATAILALSLWRWRLDTHSTGVHHHHHEGHARRQLGQILHDLYARHWPLALAILLMAATMATLSRAGILLVTVGAAILFIHVIVSHFARLDRPGRVRAGASFLLSFALLAVAVMTFLPKEVTSEVATVGATEALDRMTGRSEHHTDYALHLLQDYPLCGCGGWGYRHYSVPLMTDTERSYLKYAWSHGGANVHNDSLQFMVEHGVLGFALLVFGVVLLLGPTATAWRHLARAARFSPRAKRPPSPVAIFALPAAAFSVLVAATATFIHSFGDCPLRSPAVLSLFFIELAAVQGYLPGFEVDEDDSNDTNEE